MSGYCFQCGEQGGCDCNDPPKEKPTAPEVTRLKPCPWCSEPPNSGANYGVGGAYVICTNSACACKPELFVAARFNQDGSLFLKDASLEAEAAWNTRSRNPGHASEPDKWAQQNPEAWEALRTGRAGVYGDLVLRDKLGFEYTIRERLDKPFKSEAKEGVC